MLIAIDFETSGLDFWSDTFEVKSMAIAYYNALGEMTRHIFYGAERIREVLAKQLARGDQWVVYNAGFEYGVIKYALGFKDAHVYTDVMRMVQVFGSPTRVPMSLKYSTTRFLPEYSNYERTIKEWIIANNKVAGGKWGQYIHTAPTELLEHYNMMDAEVTLRLYTLLESKFKHIKYDWRHDHVAYMYMAEAIVDAQARGIQVDVMHMHRSKKELEQEIQSIYDAFLIKHSEGIAVVREMLKNKLQAKYKKKVVTETPEFKISSKQHLEFLFCGYYEQLPRFFTPKKKPSFKKSHLKSWDGAEGLVLLGTKTQALAQINGVLSHTENNIIHQGLKTVGTTTGRFAGSGGVNCFPIDNVEFLTPRGFLSYNDITDDDLIWQVDPATLLGSFVKPAGRVKYIHDGDIYQINTNRGSVAATGNHRILLKRPALRTDVNHLNYRETTFEELYNNKDGIRWVIPQCSALPEIPEEYDNLTLRQAICIQADGCFGHKKRYLIRFGFRKERKITRCSMLFNCTLIPYVSKGKTTWITNVRQDNPYITDDKLIDFSKLTYKDIKVFVNELEFWDSNQCRDNDKSGRFTYTTTKRKMAEDTQAYLVKHGYESRLFKRPGKEVYHLYIKKMAHCSDTRLNKDWVSKYNFIEKQPYVGEVCCFEVPSGNLLIRYNKTQTWVLGNCQGLARRSKQLMRGFVARDGYIFVSSDGAAMEPTITAEFSQDKNYRYATCDGIGKPPYYSDGVLYIDDVYIMVLSVLPFGKRLLQDLFNRIHRAPWSTYDIEGRIQTGRTFAEQWVADKSVIVDQVKPQRQLAKASVLGMGYGMRARKLRATLGELGYSITEAEAEGIYNQYWTLFSGIKKLSDKIEREVDRLGDLINPFGFRMTPEPRKGFNALIQSTVNGVIYLYLVEVMRAAPYAYFITVIHDEIIFEVPVDRLAEFKDVVGLATERVNNTLGWSIKMRFGFVSGETLYDAK